MSDGIIEKFRAKRVRKEEINDGVFELKKNVPRIVTKDNNNHTALLFEMNEGEKCYIHSEIDDESFAMICNEFYLNFLRNPKKVDLTYYFFNKSKSSVYLYDMKKTLVELDVLLHLYEQWKASVKDARYCMSVTEGYLFSDDDIHIGVITENNDVEKRNLMLHDILYPDTLVDGIPEFVKRKHYANKSDRIQKAKVLSGFDKGQVTIENKVYKFDIRTFEDKIHHMVFVNGNLEKNN